MKLFNVFRARGVSRQNIRALLTSTPFYSYLLFFLILFLMFFVNGLHESYPDEFDNILGGWRILHGHPLYSEFFTHHGPSAYFLAAIIEIFSGNSFVRFRIVYSIALFAFLLFSFWYFKKSIGSSLSKFFPLLLLFVGIGSTYFWGHMLLADNISAYFLSLSVGLVTIKHLTRKAITLSDLIYISALTFISILSSLTYLYLLLFFYLFVFVEFFLSNKLSLRSVNNYWRPLLIFGVPFLVFLIYLLLTGSLSDYLYQNFTFNQQYYIYNYPRAIGETGINPIRFAIIIANSFLMGFSDLLIQIKDFNFSFPFNITLAIANLAFLIYAFTKRRYKLVIFMLLMLIYANGRSNPLTSSERDYQSAVYILISLFNGAYLLYTLYDELKSDLEYRRKIIYTSLFLLLFVYTFANFQFLGRKFLDKAFNKYMGKAPLIYDRPQIAPLINAVLSKDDYTWIGPFEFEELFYTKEKIASQYQIFNPGMGHSEKIQNGLIADFEKTKPKLIWFDKRFYILGQNPEEYGKPFIEYLSQHYTTLLDYQRGNSKFVSVKPIEQRTDIETKLYIRIENVDEIIDKMVSLNIIKEVINENSPKTIKK